jgi:molecular chaperone GrpE
MISDEMTPEPAQEDESPTAPGSAGSDEAANLRRALEEKTREAAVNYDRYLRAVAEMDNARKRAQREREDQIRYANESLLRELLPVLDNFDRAVRAARMAEEAPGLLAGVELIRRELLKALEKFGVTAYSAVGQPFDPEKHEAVGRLETTERPEMTVVEETLAGYLLNGKVLRPAMVTVAVPPEEPGAEASSS